MMRKYLVLFLLSICFLVKAEDGSRLWLRYPEAIVDTNLFTKVIANRNSLPYQEFRRVWKELAHRDVSIQRKQGANRLILALNGDKSVRRIISPSELNSLGNEGYIIRSFNDKKGQATVIASNGDAGLLYGVNHLLRLIQLGGFSQHLDIIEKPSYAIRILNHWDNLDGTVERGYSGKSIWKWDELPSKISPRYLQYARANASIGINATVLNNVNASPKTLTIDYLKKAQAIADVLRPYHIKVYLSINFSSPKVIGGLSTADPLVNNVRKWWREKVKEIYQLIPDFGGFLVKANSEGLPGPMDYGRTHVDGANMLAEALQPYRGIVMWRAFVYEPGDDRAKLAYNEFHRYDGLFRDNVVIQVKNGPIDFQPREPFSPLFGAMKRSAVMPELQITQEYLGQGIHLVFLAPMWKEFLTSDTYCEGEGSTIDKLTTGQIYPQKTTAIAGVANIGEDTNWCGHHFAQSNWYAFGRLAWNPRLSASQIADEWIRLTFQNAKVLKKKIENRDKIIDNNTIVGALKEIVLSSHETVVDYMMPLGLHHLFAWTHHYGPEPWCDIAGARPDWLPKYYHKADSLGIGFDRSTTGSNAVQQYYSPLREQLNDPTKCPEKYLLWFHHLPWDYKMKSGNTLWDELCYSYNRGVKQVRGYQANWDKLSPYIDSQRFEEVKAKFVIQTHDAVWWKDACLLYFQTFSKRPFPAEVEAPVYQLDSLKKIKLEMKHHN